MAISWMAVLMGVVGLRLAVIDLETHRLPNRLTMPLCAALMVILVAAGDDAALRGALRGSVLTGTAFLGIACLPGRPLGMGDVKLQFSCGWLLGSVSVTLALLGAALSFILGGMAVAPGLLTRRRDSLDAIAFGPWMVASTCVVVVAAQSLKII